MRIKAIFLPTLILCGFVLIAAAPHRPAGQVVPKAQENIFRAREFLRSLYPSLSGKGYMMSLQTSQQYDVLASVAFFKLFIGEGPVGFVKGVVGGYVGPVPPPDYHPGPIYATQFLTADFQFRPSGQLFDFSAYGPSVGDEKASTRAFEQVSSHPKLTDSEVIAVLKKEGAKYGPWNREQFLHDLPLQKIEPFLGRLSEVSAKFTDRDEDSHFVTGEWSDWKVNVVAVWKDGVRRKYQLKFEGFKGDLVTINPLPE
jgi:hypothetical protein